MHAGNVERIRALLDHVPDPEIPVISIVELGIVRDVTVEDHGKGAVVLTTTYTGCPATFAIESAVRSALDQAGFKDVAITRRLDPPWTTDWISDAGREKLRDYGIAPPPHSNSLREHATPACPQCGSTHTEELSRFGSTPCKALWRCLDCAEPFDHFKCH
jgi:ring-1,2-phenylacetyl-CoA epoxidase subunit PaaD